jgi:hypothetical protein
MDTTTSIETNVSTSTEMDTTTTTQINHIR